VPHRYGASAHANDVIEGRVVARQNDSPAQRCADARMGTRELRQAIPSSSPYNSVSIQHAPCQSRQRCTGGDENAGQAVRCPAGEGAVSAAPASPPPRACSGNEARRLTVAGRVQAVGFRPFVFRLASRCGLAGFVRNRAGVVEIGIAGPGPAVAAFRRELLSHAPPLAAPEIVGDEAWSEAAGDAFQILPSCDEGPAAVSLPPDFFACAECLAELNEPTDRRHAYPFVSCTQCGPRYTVIESLPFDRPFTTMADFPLCEDCEAEYREPGDRRHHAEISACPACGPTLSFTTSDGTQRSRGPAALTAALAALRTGQIVAARGVGGYHLLCDARNAESVGHLRQRKRRPTKPMAVLFPWGGHDGLALVREEAQLDAVATSALVHPERPIVLVQRRGDGRLAAGIAPGLDEIGVFLPYTPMLELLTARFGSPLVATSGNLSGEPIAIGLAQAETRLRGVADAFLHHNRRILRPADDSVRRVIAGRARPLRLGRGLAPLELRAPWAFSVPTLAIGGHLKNTLALGIQHRVVVSPHIGDLGNPLSLDLLVQLARELPALYRVTVERLVCDAHPDYGTSRWAKKQSQPLVPVPHHFAHASGLVAEYGLVDTDTLVFTWDGVGLGPDGALWGGECLYGRPGRWRRVASLIPFPSIGGERVAQEPWRIAAAMCRAAGVERELPAFLDDVRRGLFSAALAGAVTAPLTSATGRLFDGAAALVLGVEVTSFEAEAAMRLEAVADNAAAPIPLPLVAEPSGLLRLDWRPLVPLLLDGSRSIEWRAGVFHATLAAAILAMVRRFAAGPWVGLTGGVFQNRRLTGAAAALLEQSGFKVLIPDRLPCNDGGLSFGQLIEGTAHER